MIQIYFDHNYSYVSYMAFPTASITFFTDDCRRVSRFTNAKVKVIVFFLYASSNKKMSKLYKNMTI